MLIKITACQNQNLTSVTFLNAVNLFLRNCLTVMIGLMETYNH